MIPKDVTPERTIDFEEIARNSYRLVEEARAQRRSAAMARVQSRFDDAGMSISRLNAVERERAIEREALGDRRYRFVLYADGHVAVGQLHQLRQIPMIVAHVSIDVMSPYSLAGELAKSYVHSHDLARRGNLIERERMQRLNYGLARSW